MDHDQAQAELLSNPFEAWRPRAGWGLRALDVFERNDPAEIEAYVDAHAAATPPILREADGELQSRVLCSGRKPDHRLYLFNSMSLFKKGQAKRLLGEPAASQIRSLHLMSGGALDALLDAPEWPFRLVSLRLDFAPKPEQFEAMAAHSGFASLEFFGLYNSLKERFHQLAALPWLPQLRSLALSYVLDRAREEQLDALAAVPFERLQGLVISAKDWAVPARTMKPLVEASWIPGLRHVEIDLPSKSPKLNERLIARLDLPQLQSWRIHGALDDEAMAVAFARLGRCTRLNRRPVSPDEKVGVAPAQALVDSGCAPNLYNSVEGFSDEAIDLLAAATGRPRESFWRGKPRS